MFAELWWNHDNSCTAGAAWTAAGENGSCTIGKNCFFFFVYWVLSKNNKLHAMIVGSFFFSLTSASACAALPSATLQVISQKIGGN